MGFRRGVSSSPEAGNAGIDEELSRLITEVTNEINWHMREHNLATLLAAGLKATVNSDDPAYFGGYIDANFAAVRREMNVSDQQIVTLARNSFDACFTTEAQRSRWKAELETAAAGADG